MKPTLRFPLFLSLAILLQAGPVFLWSLESNPAGISPAPQGAATNLIVKLRTQQHPLDNWTVETRLDFGQLAKWGGLPSDAGDCVIEVWEKDPSGKNPAQMPAELVTENPKSPDRRDYLVWIAKGLTPPQMVRRFEIRFRPAALSPSIRAAPEGAATLHCAWDEDNRKVKIANPWFEITHDTRRGGALVELGYPRSNGKIKIGMEDSIVQNQQEYRVRDDHDPEMNITGGKLRTVVEVKTVFKGSAGEKDRPVQTTYRYTYYATLPLIRLETRFAEQRLPQPCEAVQQACFTFPRTPFQFQNWMSGEPLMSKALANSPATISLGSKMGISGEWGLLNNAQDALGIIGANLDGIYHTKESLALRGLSIVPWRGGPWIGNPFDWNAHLYVGPTEQAVAYARAAASYHLELEIPAVSGRLTAARNRLESLPPAGRTDLAVAAMLLRSAERRTEQARELDGAIQLLELAEKMLKEPKPMTELPLAIETPSFLALANEQTALLFKITPQTAALDGIFHNVNRHAFLAPATEPRPLWELQFKEVGPTDGWIRVNSARARAVQKQLHRPKDGVLQLDLRWLAPEGDPAEVRVNVTLQKGDPLSRWKIHVKPANPKLGLWHVNFPVISGISREPAEGNDFMVLPSKSGLLIRNPSQGAEYNNLFPGEVSMQFLPYWQEGAPGGARPSSGLFLGAYDGEANVKRFIVGNAGGGAEIIAQHPVPNMGVAGAAFDLTFPFVAGAFDGDWFDAAKMYRHWAQQQKWMPKQSLLTNPDIPKWFKESSLTFRCSAIVHTNLAEHAAAWARAFGAPAMFNLYDWTTNHHDIVNAPEIHPRPVYREAARQMRAANLYPVPYVLFTSWHTNSVSWVRDRAAQAATRNADQSFQLGMWYDIPVAHMCPVASTWQNRLKTTFTQVIEAGDVYGVYMDLAGTSCGLLCMSAEHGHPVGGGHHYIDGTRTIMKNMRELARKKHPEFVTLMEGNSECYLDVVDAYVLFNGVSPANLQPENVPMFQAVYADYLRPYGGKGFGYRGNGDEEGLTAAQGFVFGCPVGRIFTERAVISEKDPPAYAYLKQLLAFRQAAHPYLAYGEMLRPLALIYTSGPDRPLYRAGLAVATATWRAPGGGVAFVFANGMYPGDPTAFKYKIVPKEYGIPTDGSHALYLLTPQARSLLQEIKGPVERDDQLPAWGVRILVAAPSQ
ncbi:MAG: hypothetical protein HY360_23340 [Verrucomicrobia bacterium]|nr:hypothetical protein [Verrucomicrobiota bacterium]